MRILITNDDGIDAPGLKTLEAIARDVAGPDGDVWTVAPAFEQSGVGHCINYTKPTLVTQLGPRRFAAEGSPADCVLAGVHDVMPERPDLVLSGVNRGNNSAENTLYSGTIGAAMEAALQGLPALALSQYFGLDNRDLADPFEAAAKHGADVVRAVLKAGFDIDDAYSLFLQCELPAGCCQRRARCARGHPRAQTRCVFWDRTIHLAVWSALFMDQGRRSAGSRAAGF